MRIFGLLRRRTDCRTTPGGIWAWRMVWLTILSWPETGSVSLSADGVYELSQ